jgi:Secretion system C-terminal sorting domain
MQSFPNCPTVNPCLDNLNVCDGYLLYVYAAIVILDSSCTNWTFQVNVNRPNNITNIIGVNSSVIATCNTIARQSNNSNIELDIPFIKIGADSNMIVGCGMYDLDNDSLFIEIHNPLDSSYFTLPPNLTFKPGYTLTQPLGMSNSFSINNNNGQLHFNALQSGLFLVTFKVSEYDRNTQSLLCTKFHDVLIYVSPCLSQPYTFVNSALPHIQNIQNGWLSTDTICDVYTTTASALNFNIYYIHNNFSNNMIAVTSNNQTAASGSLVNAYFDTNLLYNVINFKWNPTVLDTGMHILNFRIKDTLSCQPYSPVLFPIKIKVVNFPLQITKATSTFANLIYPNPAQQFINYINTGKVIASNNLEIRNLMNETVYKNPETIYQQTCRIDVSNLPNGFYYLINKTNNTIEKISIQK